MKALFIAYNQAYNDEIVDLLAENRQRGYTRWTDIQGKGNFNGIPRLGSHAWPEMNHAVLVMVEDEKVRKLLSELKAKDEASPDLGLRAFVWNIENFY